MPKIQGIGVRIAERMKAKGYWNARKNFPEVIRFSEELGYNHSYVYRWISGQVPRGYDLLRLARDLEVAPDWLVEAAVPLRRRAGRYSVLMLACGLTLAGWVPAEARTLPAGPRDVACTLSAVDRFWRRLIYGFKLRLAATGAA